MSKLKDILAARKLTGQKLPPPKASEVAKMNAPEGVKDTETARVVSQGVGELSGGYAKTKDKAREVAIAVQGVEDAEEAAPIVAEAVAQVELDDARSKLSITQREVLDLMKAGTGVFAKKGINETDDMPFIHGRTLCAMQKAGLINYRDDFPEAGQRTVRPTDKARAIMGIPLATAEPAAEAAPPAATPKPTAGALTQEEFATAYQLVAQTLERLPDGKAKACAKTKLQECMFWTFAGMQNLEGANNG